MKIQFYKYEGTGNDFILLDNRSGHFNDLHTENIKFLCDRHFGVGADGLMLLNLKEGFDFEMRYYNSDGHESSMCGNGGRCITAFAKDLKLIHDSANFVAIDGPHVALINEESYIELKMNDVHKMIIREESFELNTGSPHYIHYSEEIATLDMKREGALIRYSPLYKEEGINVNFVEVLDNKSIFVRTYERGVEDETLSCGTGVTASALTYLKDLFGEQSCKVVTLGGTLMVKCINMDGQRFEHVWLCGSAKFVFKGEIVI